MTYKYECKSCEIVSLIDKPMSESGRVEICPVCKSELKRVWESSAIKTGDGMKR